MPRPIKFRAWGKEKKIWLHGEWRITPDGFIETKEVNDTGQPEYMDWVRNKADKRFELEQFTGILDKNKVEIYEGDIVRLRDRDKLTGIIEYHDGEYAFSDNGGSYNPLHDLFSDGRGEELEVIGNIHENPELLE